jgi:type II secretory pathway pseudopilin PulG
MNTPAPGAPRTARAFTLIETAVATLVSGVLLVAALNAVGAARTSEFEVVERERGLLLGQALLSEILQQAYEDPALPPGSFGLGADESGPDRTLWEDVDDYHGLVDDPPRTRDGAAIAWASEYERRARVSWVTLADPRVTAASNTGIKSIVVTVYRGEQLVCTLSAFRTCVWLHPADSTGVGP